MTSATTPLLDDSSQLPRTGPVDDDDHNSDAPQTSLLSFRDALSLTLSIQIGSGIFLSPSLVARNIPYPPTLAIPPPILALLVWATSGLLAWTCAACYAEMGSRIPVNGGPQEYLAFCFGDLVGFLTGWVCIWGVKPCSSAVLALFVGGYVGDAVGLEKGWEGVIALGVVAVVTVVNCVGNGVSKGVSMGLLGCKIIGVGFVIFMGIWTVLTGMGMEGRGVKAMHAEGDRGSYVDALVAAMWAYSGWEVLGLVGGNIRNPGKNFPRVMNSSMSIVLALTLFANVSYFSVLGFDEVARSTTLGLIFSQHFLGRAGSVLYAVAICLSTLGTLNVKMFTAGRLTQAAAERGYLPLMMKTVARRGSSKDDDEDHSILETRHLPPIIESPNSPVRLGDGSIPM
ncbi:amino acid/polyamine transporter I [Echria macrotheca]|uniref:Amino acid/polyamine transporter I n=1 Tax=Echria macrotheca TaxID=438768 RepID=A0AAJ0B1A2_9PEZI|nr:amino acid/polyamine transporter I [Echria macrotheca]